MANNQSDQIALSGNLTRDEVTDSFWRFHKATILVMPAVQCFIIFSFVGICAACGVAFKAVLMPGIFGILGLVLACVILVAVPIGVTKAYLWSERTGYYYDTISFYSNQIDYVVTMTGISVKGADIDHVYTWSEFKQVFETPSAYVIQINIKNIIKKLTDEKVLLIIPKRFCKDATQQAEITRMLRSGITEYAVQKK